MGCSSSNSSIKPAQILEIQPTKSYEIRPFKKSSVHSRDSSMNLVQFSEAEGEKIEKHIKQMNESNISSVSSSTQSHAFLLNSFQELSKKEARVLDSTWTRDLNSLTELGVQGVSSNSRTTIKMELSGEALDHQNENYEDLDSREQLFQRTSLGRIRTALFSQFNQNQQKTKSSTFLSKGTTSNLGNIQEADPVDEMSLRGEEEHCSSKPSIKRSRSSHVYKEPPNQLKSSLFKLARADKSKDQLRNNSKASHFSKFRLKHAPKASGLGAGCEKRRASSESNLSSESSSSSEDEETPKDNSFKNKPNLRNPTLLRLVPLKARQPKTGFVCKKVSSSKKDEDSPDNVPRRSLIVEREKPAGGLTFSNEALF